MRFLYGRPHITDILRYLRDNDERGILAESLYSGSGMADLRALIARHETHLRETSQTPEVVIANVIRRAARRGREAGTVYSWDYFDRALGRVHRRRGPQFKSRSRRAA